VDDGVDKVCRHAGHVVRSLGTELWRRLTKSQKHHFELGKRDPPAVWKKNLAKISRLDIPNYYPQAGRYDLWITRLTEAGAQAPPT
jgi:hypothetical protein